MVERSKVIGELVAQHEALRTIMDDCEQLADQLDVGRGELRRLVHEVNTLRLAFEAHNEAEELALAMILGELGAFGAARIDHMVEDHVREHRALRERLDAPNAQLRSTLYELRAHLATEERMFLSIRGLGDDVVSVESKR